MRRFDLISTCIESWLLQKAETNKRLRQMASVANLRTVLHLLHLFSSIFSHICIAIYAIELLLLLLVASVANGICMGVSAVIGMFPLLNAIRSKSSSLLNILVSQFLLSIPPGFYICELLLQLVQITLLSQRLLLGYHDFLPQLRSFGQCQLPTSHLSLTELWEIVEEQVFVVELELKLRPLSYRLGSHVVSLEDLVCTIQVANSVDNPLCFWGAD